MGKWKPPRWLKHLKKSVDELLAELADSGLVGNWEPEAVLVPVRVRSKSPGSDKPPGKPT
jgi:hypothetical protein